MAELALEQSLIRPAAPSEGSTADERAWILGTQNELNGYYKMLERFIDLDPREIMQQIAAIAARLTTIRATAQRMGSARVNSLRTREIDPLIEACEFQFKCQSRIAAIMESEWKMAGGGT